MSKKKEGAAKKASKPMMKFPRAMKRMWLLGRYNSPEQRAAVKWLFLEANETYTSSKKKKSILVEEPSAES